VREITWLDAESWASKGGSEIGTNRGLPSADLPTAAMCFEKYSIDALFVIGGFEAFTAVSELRKARTSYPAFQIPMVVLPATVSNNVPGTEYSIGSDTCLNALIDYCDAIKQSAAASRRRVFVVETQGGASGYIATLAGLSIGATAVYTPEQGINLQMLASDIQHLKDQFAKDRGQNRSGKIILRNEKASKTYTTEIVTDIIREESGGRFDARFAVPGHVQQGGIPSPMDRVRAVRFGVRSVQHLEHFLLDDFSTTDDEQKDEQKDGKDEQKDGKEAENAGKEENKSEDERRREWICNNDLSASVIGIRGAKVTFGSMKRIEEEETNWTCRRPKEEFWAGLMSVVDTLSGRPPVTSTSTSTCTTTTINNNNKDDDGDESKSR